jgi:hypothetical protein
MMGVSREIAQPGFDAGDAFAGFDGGGTGHGTDDGLEAGPLVRSWLGGHGHGSGQAVVILAQTGLDRAVISGGEHRGFGMELRIKLMSDAWISRPDMLDRAFSARGWQ